MNISKIQYIRGLQCHKSLWRKANGISPNNQNSKESESLFSTGYSVGDCAKERFPGGIDVTSGKYNINEMVEATKKAIDGGANILYEASFTYDGIFVAVDILKKTKEGWSIYEVKSSTKIKNHHLDDLSIQYFVASKYVNIDKIYLLHINSKYERLGDVDLEQLLVPADCTDATINKQSEVVSNLKDFKLMLAEDEPEIEIGAHCSTPYSCEYVSQCWAHIPTPSVFDLYRMKMSKKMKLYNQGVICFDQIPANYKLSKIQILQINAVKREGARIDGEKIREFVDKIKFPVSFFDFETFQNAIPRFDHQNPYMQMPFQYSLHILDNKGRLDHLEFLGDEYSDPRRFLCEKMLKDIPKCGSIVAYNQSFEIGRIKELAKLFPDLKLELLELNKRFVDLMIPFRNGGYYHPDFNGRFSIKKVLPALFPDDEELDYKKLGISDGGVAMEIFADLHKLKDPTNRDKIRRDLLAYCHLDTIAMVRIFEFLVKTIKKGNKYESE